MFPSILYKLAGTFVYKSWKYPLGSMAMTSPSHPSSFQPILGQPKAPVAAALGSGAKRLAQQLVLLSIAPR